MNFMKTFGLLQGRLKSHLSKISDMNIFRKLIITFIIIIFVPFTISFYVFQKTANDMTVGQISSETSNSIELASNSIDSLLKKMASIALYVNDDESIKELIIQEMDELEEPTPSNRENGLIWKGIEKNYIESDAGLHPYVLTLVKNIYNNSGEKQYGTIIISVPEDEVSRLVTTENQLQKRVILDKNLVVISSTVKGWLNKPFKSIRDCEFPEEPKGYFMIDDIKGDKSVISYNTVGNWKVVDIKSYNDITKQLGNVRNRLLIINAIFLLGFLCISALIARNISKPLRKLTRLMLKTDLESSYGDHIGKRYDEIGILEESFNVMRTNIKTLMQDNLEKERKKRDAELQSLQAQISPHFLFNTLNAVRWAAINNNVKKAADMVLALSNLLRMTIVKGDELITVEEEIENLKNYSAIFQMRHSVEFQLHCSIDEEIRKYRIPKLLLQPLVENAIIHGFEGKVTDGVIDITGVKRDGFVILCVKDNGVGIKTDSGLKGENAGKLKFSGIGIKNVDERIKLYFGEKYGLKLTGHEGKGTSAEVWLPEQHGEARLPEQHGEARHPEQSEERGACS